LDEYTNLCLKKGIKFTVYNIIEMACPPDEPKIFDE